MGRRPHPLESLCRAIPALFFLACSLPMGAAAHPTADERLAAMESRSEAGCDARQRLERAMLLAEQGDRAAALAGLDRAEDCTPLAEIDLARAGLYLRSGQAASAKDAAARYLQTRPDDGRGWLLKARAERELGEWAAAVADFDHAIPLLEPAQPDQYLERAQAQLQLGRAADAARNLNIGIRRIGPAPALVTLAVDLDCAAGRHLEALATLEQLSPVQRESPAWLLRRAEILAPLGRTDEARALCRRAREKRPQTTPQNDLARTCAHLEENP